MPNRNFWVDAKETLEQTSKTTPTSSRILGIGVVCVSFLILSIGLIVGLKFPRFVEERITEDLCVVSEKYDHYHEWEFDEQLVRREKVYFWNITNMQDVMDGLASPIFAKVGPYVYRKKATKADIMFLGEFSSYKYVITFEFDLRATMSECGVTCAETNKISSINLETIREIRNFKNHQDYVTRDIPDWINSKIKELSALQTNGTENLFSLLGSVNRSHWGLDCLEADTQLVSNISFGRWIALNDTEDKKGVLEFRNNSDFSSFEMDKLYNVIMSLSSADNSIDCKNFLVTAPNECQKYLIGKNTSSNCTTEDESGLMYSNYYNICGIFDFLKSINNSNKNCFMFSSDWVGQLFCLETDLKCKTLASNYQYKTDFILALKGFVFEYLASVLRNTSSILKPSLFHSLDIRHLALGHEHVIGYQSGILTKKMTKQQNHFSVAVTLSTCLMDRDSANNMVIYKYQDIRIPRNVQQYTYFIPSLKNFKCCSNYRSSLEFFKHFSLELGCSVIFEFQKIEDFSGVDLYRFRHGEHKCPEGYSLPCCDSEDGTIMRSLAGSYIDIEPITGRFWKKILHEKEELNLESLNNTLHGIYPLVDWSAAIRTYDRRSSVELSVSSINQYNTRVNSMMKASCIGMISLTTIATIVFLVAVCIICWPQARTKVHPFILEQSHNLQQHYRSTA